MDTTNINRSVFEIGRFRIYTTPPFDEIIKTLKTQDIIYVIYEAIIYVSGEDERSRRADLSDPATIPKIKAEMSVAIYSTDRDFADGEVKSPWKTRIQTEVWTVYNPENRAFTDQHLFHNADQFKKEIDVVLAKTGE